MKTDEQLAAEAGTIWTLVFTRDPDGRELLMEGADEKTREIMFTCFQNGYIAGYKRSKQEAE